MAISDRPGENETIMTLSEVARFLKVGERTILKMIHEGEIPGIRIGNQWRFMGPMIEQWLLSKARDVPQDELTRLIESDDSAVPVSRLIDPRFVVLDIESGTVPDVLRRLSAPLLNAEEITADGLESLVNSLVYREGIRSTAVEDGVAFPHLRTPAHQPVSGPVILVGRCPEGTEFGAPDGKPTHLFFMVCTRSIVVHLRTMAKLAQAIQSTGIKNAIMSAGTEEEVLAAFLGLA